MVSSLRLVNLWNFLLQKAVEDKSLFHERVRYSPQAKESKGYGQDEAQCTQCGLSARFILNDGTTEGLNGLSYSGFLCFYVRTRFHRSC